MIAGYDPYETANEDCYYDEIAAEKVITFAESFCTHVKGKKAREKFLLEDWQKEYLRALFGWKIKSTEYRRYRTSLLEVARKNGKTTLAAIVGLYTLIADNELGAEIILAATTRDQSSILFDIVAGMVRQNSQLNKRLNLLDSRKRLVFPKTNSFLAAISADAGSHHGLNAHCVIYDEIHAAPNRDLYDVLTTSQGARTQPLFLITTTSGWDRQSICYELHDYACKVRDNLISDIHFLPAIYSAPDNADWKLEETWKLANPNFNVSISREYLAKECKKAQQLPAYENTFRQLHLSQWTEQATRWIPQSEWEQCQSIFPDLKGRECYGGLDLSSTRDTSALVLAFPIDNKIYLKAYFWIPEEGAKQREETDKVPYRLWSKDENLELTPGNVVDDRRIEAKILTLASEYQIKEIRYDRWSANRLVASLTDEGLNLVPLGQGFASMSAPSKQFETWIMDKTLAHDANKVLDWQISNVAVATDPSGNIKPVKPEHKSSKKIDGVVAAIMAVSGCMGNQRDSQIYDGRLLVI